MSKKITAKQVGKDAGKWYKAKTQKKVAKDYRRNSETYGETIVLEFSLEEIAKWYSGSKDDLLNKNHTLPDIKHTLRNAIYPFFYNKKSATEKFRKTIYSDLSQEEIEDDETLEKSLDNSVEWLQGGSRVKDDDGDLVGCSVYFILKPRIQEKTFKRRLKKASEGKAVSSNRGEKGL